MREGGNNWEREKEVVIGGKEAMRKEVARSIGARESGEAGAIGAQWCERRAAIEAEGCLRGVGPVALGGIEIGRRISIGRGIAMRKEQYQLGERHRLGLRWQAEEGRRFCTVDSMWSTTTHLSSFVQYMQAYVAFESKQYEATG